MQDARKKANHPALIVGVVLMVLAGIVWWDASRMTISAVYGIGPTATPHVISLFLLALGVGHLVTTFREGLPTAERADWRAVGLVSLALFALMASIALGGGFILGSTLLFAFTARAFGRRALLVDLFIGLSMGIVIYLVFNNLLTLVLPQGPLERLL